ncbi:hypothetical protein PM082_024598 [Marasmius tenuissimus]|nr:hypothetical protein PM082_024598 [Marasmius tenuissimus]
MNTNMRNFAKTLALLSLSLLASSQTCENYGSQNQSSCSCPTGFGGSSCAEIACGGTLFQGPQRRYTSTSSGNPNITASGCQCEGGWTGTACNVCGNDNACQSAFVSVRGQGDTGSGTPGISLNTTMVCNKSPRVYSSSQMSCAVNNPTLKAIYPGASSLNIIRTVDGSLSPIPDVTSFGSQNTMYAQLFYNGEEQFYCHADSCNQQVEADSRASYTCKNLQCTCKPNATFCGRGTTNLTQVLNGLVGDVGIECGSPDSSTNQASCAFKQEVIQQVFGSNGLSLDGCAFGECVRQNIIDNNVGGTNSTSTDGDGGSSLSGGVIAGLAVVGGLLLIALLLLLLGLCAQRRARKAGYNNLDGGGVTVRWNNVSYIIPGAKGWLNRKKDAQEANSDKVILDGVSGRVVPGQMMAILGPSGAGKTTLVEILAGKHKSGVMTGSVSFPSSNSNTNSKPRIGFVPQQDVLPPMLTVYEAILFAARLRLPEGISDVEKQSRVEQLMEKLGISHLRSTRIGYGAEASGGRNRGISGGEMRRVSIGLELIASPDVLILDEPTSGLDSVSAWRVANVLRSIAHDQSNPTAVIASIHQPSSQLYQAFDTILVLSHGHALYSGPGALAPIDYLANSSADVPRYQQGYNVADYLLEVASDPPLSLLQSRKDRLSLDAGSGSRNEKPTHEHHHQDGPASKEETSGSSSDLELVDRGVGRPRSRYATTFLTQLEYLSGREWKILRRDKSLFLTHVVVSAVLGVFCGGLYYQTDETIAGFQSRVGCLFFLGALIAFSSLSALYNIVEIRPLFLRERSSGYYSPTAWLLSRFLFDVIPLRIVPTIIVSTITYWMAGLSHNAANYFKFLFILVLYTLAMTLFNFLLGTLFHNGGIAILLSALTALYQMTYAGFFVHLNAIPPVLRWLQWLCPLKYCLEAMAVNEVGSGLMIQDTLQGVPVNVSASLIMNLLFGFGSNNYYRDVLVLFAFIAGFGVGVIGVVWLKVRERR